MIFAITEQSRFHAAHTFTAVLTLALVFFLSDQFHLSNQFLLLPLSSEVVSYRHTTPALSTDPKLAIKEAILRSSRHCNGFGDAPPDGLTGALKGAIELARTGNADAECLIGCMYASSGCSCSGSVNFAVQIFEELKREWCLGLAVNWYKRAAEHGSAPAAAELGYMYEQGWGVSLDNAQALSWYQRAADAGDLQAKVDLGSMYEYGKGVEVNLKQAMALYEESRKAEFEAGYLPVSAHNVERLWAKSGITPSFRFTRGETNAFDFVCKYGDYWEAGSLARVYDPLYAPLDGDKVTPDRDKSLALYRLSQSRKTFPTYSREEAHFFGMVNSRIAELQYNK